jgi:hypothetical protein
MAKATVTYLFEQQWTHEFAALVIDHGNIPNEKSLWIKQKEEYWTEKKQDDAQVNALSDALAATRLRKACAKLGENFSIGVYFMGDRSLPYHDVCFLNHDQLEETDRTRRMKLQRIWIDENLARSMVLHLYQEGFFGRAQEVADEETAPAASSFYRIVVRTVDSLPLVEDLPCDAQMIRRMDAIFDVLRDLQEGIIFDTIRDDLNRIRLQLGIADEARDDGLAHVITPQIMPEGERLELLALGPQMFGINPIIDEVITCTDPLTVTVRYAQPQADDLQFPCRPLLRIPVVIGKGMQTIRVVWKPPGQPLTVHASIDGRAVTVSDPIVVNGISFSTMIERDWSFPSNLRAKPLLFGVRIDNQSAPSFTWLGGEPVFIGPDGRASPCENRSNHVLEYPPLRVEPGETRSMWFGAHAARADHSEIANISYSDHAGGTWSASQLANGLWKLHVHYEDNALDNPARGRVVDTPDVTFTISAQPQP